MKPKKLIFLFALLVSNAFASDVKTIKLTSETVKSVKSFFSNSKILSSNKESLDNSKLSSGLIAVGTTTTALGVADELLLKAYSTNNLSKAYTLFWSDYQAKFPRIAIKYTKKGSPKYNNYLKQIAKSNRLAKQAKAITFIETNANRLMKFGGGAAMSGAGLYLVSDEAGSASTLSEYYETQAGLNDVVNNYELEFLTQEANYFDTLKINILVMKEHIDSLK